MRIKIVSDGSPNGLRVKDAETGEDVNGVRGIRFTGWAGQGPPTVELSLLVHDFDLTADVTGGEAITIPGETRYRLVPDTLPIRRGEWLHPSAGEVANV